MDPVPCDKCGSEASLAVHIVAGITWTFPSCSRCEIMFRDEWSGFDIHVWIIEEFLVQCVVES